MLPPCCARIHVTNWRSKLSSARVRASRYVVPDGSDAKSRGTDDELRGRRKSILAVLLEAAKDEPLECVGHLGSERPHRCGGFVHHAGHQIEERFGLEGPPSRHEKIQNDAERPHVGARVDIARRTNLFRRHERGRSEKRAGTIDWSEMRRTVLVVAAALFLGALVCKAIVGIEDQPEGRPTSSKAGSTSWRSTTERAAMIAAPRISPR